MTTKVETHKDELLAFARYMFAASRHDLEITREKAMKVFFSHEDFEPIRAELEAVASEVYA